MPEIIALKDILHKMISHCKALYPKEACGIISGLNNIAKNIYTIKNIEDSGLSYLMDPREQFTVMKEIRNNGDKMLAIYHSHPSSPAFPSNKDISLSFYPDVLYIIVSLEECENPEIRVFEITDGNVSEIKMNLDGIE